MSLPPPPRDWVEVTVSAYNLRWVDLRHWLLEIFKSSNAEFNEKQVRHSPFSSLPLWQGR
ncbi:hypothetical protein CMUS01_14952 [Colletotrichum musicola]|uniref:Uncharacterized protein n=1 Tax=Colletotrichum musicola TaxID=2175873 RepID=A0A8H6J087_9PEZI|nr:hypothetical protein CMUS01_14952 [Colletotrichum musicola]